MELWWDLRRCQLAYQQSDRSIIYTYSSCCQRYVTTSYGSWVWKPRQQDREFGELFCTVLVSDFRTRDSMTCSNTKRMRLLLISLFSQHHKYTSEKVEASASFILLTFHIPIGTFVQAVLSVWITLQILEVTCAYKHFIAVVFRMFNFERLWQVTNLFLDEVSDSEFTMNGK